MSVGSLVLVFTSIVDTVSPTRSPTKTVLPSGVNTIPSGGLPTGMSVGSLVLVLTSIVDTESLPVLATKAVARHCLRAGTDDSRAGPRPTSAPDNPHTTTPPTHRHRRIAAPHRATASAFL